MQKALSTRQHATAVRDNVMKPPPDVYRHYTMSCDSVKYANGKPYQVDLVKMLQKNMDTGFTQPVWRRPVSPAASASQLRARLADLDAAGKH